jgi:predicted RNase H-like nuclease (RuvC/YqgF family)|tara:strand:+ start:619 stop:882 length:264 start_codon:yes stop_codon:yes gene_type:complete
MEKEDIQRIFSKDINSKVAVQANEIKHLHADVEDMKKDIEEIKKSLANIDKVLSEARGGWKTLMWAAGAGSAVTAFLIMIQQLFWGK